MKKVVILATCLSFAASMGMAQAVPTPTTKAEALQQLNTVAPNTVMIGGVAVSEMTLAALIVALAAIVALSGQDNGGSSSSSST